MNDILEELRNGCPLHPKRWSGDCGESSRVNEDAADAIMTRAANEIEFLRKELHLAHEKLNNHEPEIRAMPLPL